MKLIHIFALMTTIGITTTATTPFLLPDALPAGILLTVGGSILTLGEWLHGQAEAARRHSSGSVTERDRP